jgi:hypothetical protein
VFLENENGKTHSVIAEELSLIESKIGDIFLSLYIDGEEEPLSIFSEKDFNKI